MTQNEFVALFTEASGLPKIHAKKALAAFQETLQKALTESDRLALPGLGIFSVQEKAARKGRNPATGAEIEIPAKKVLRFKPAKELADAIR